MWQGTRMLSSGYFPDVAFEDQTLNTVCVCAELFNSPGLLLQNHRAQVKGSLKEELNCTKFLAASLLFIHHQLSASIRQPVSFLFHVLHGCAAGACMIWLCMWQQLTHGAWRPFLYAGILRVDSALCLPEDKIPRTGIQTASTNLWVNFSKLFKLSNSLMHSRSHPLFFSSCDTWLYNLVASLCLVCQDRW